LQELEDIKLHLKCISQRLDELEAMGISERDLFDSSAFQEAAEVKSIKKTVVQVSEQMVF
jgi:DNA-binding HxlR family transcriptional regulator